MIEIREAEAEDRDAVARLIEQLEERAIDREAFNAVYQENLNNPQIVYQIALSEGKIRGFVSVHVQKLLHHTAPIAEIQELVVDEKCRGQGVGKLLFGKAKKSRRTPAVRSWNVRAINAGLPVMPFIKSRE